MKSDLLLRGDLHAPRAARMALDELVYELDGRLLSDLRLVVTEMVTAMIRTGHGAPLAVRVEVLSSMQVRGEVEEEERGDHPIARAALGAQSRPILDGLTGSWGVGPHPRRMWFEIETE